MKNIHPKQAKYKTTTGAHIQMLLMVFTIAAVAFSAGYYLATAQAIAMVTK